MSTPRAMTHSSLDLFDGVPILEPIECSNAQKIYHTSSLNESSLEFHFESDRNKMINLHETFVFFKVTLNKGNVALEAADDAIFLSITQCILFFHTVRFILITNKFILPMDSMLTKRSSLKIFLIRQEPEVLFALVKVKSTRKNQHRLETNPSSLVKQRRRRKFAFVRSLPLLFSLAIWSYSPTSKSGYD